MTKPKKKDLSEAGGTGRPFVPGWAWIEALGPKTREIV